MNGDPDRIRDRVAGRLRYAIDVAVDGMLHAALVRSPLAAGRLVGVDTSAAARLPGVRAVVTAADLARLPLVDRRFGTIVPDQPILAADRVSHVGEPVAAVVADTEDVARRAARLVRLEIVPERAVLDVESALAPGAPTVNERAPDNVLGRWGYRNGDLDAARASTRRIFVGEYTSPAAQQVTLESQVCVARWIAGRLELWAATQSPSRVAAELARLFGLPDEAVRV
ncbi:MAG TPA: molybdopterin cofactor-binding domain-containing protein, partial [Candidatus Limnocylindrales bacterium]|nr:molybdopterin cofactor-binding domain-containing protein [Candidatus Limnocylindrales bacterium]